METIQPNSSKPEITTNAGIGNPTTSNKGSIPSGNPAASLPPLPPCLLEMLKTNIPENELARTLQLVAEFLTTRKMDPNDVSIVVTAINAAQVVALSENNVEIILLNAFNVKNMRGCYFPEIRQFCKPLGNLECVPINEREKVKEIMNNDKMKSNDKCNFMADTIRTGLLRLGGLFYINENEEMVLKIGHEELVLNAKSPSLKTLSFFSGTYRINPGAKYYWEYVIFELCGVGYRKRLIPYASSSIGGNIGVPILYWALGNNEDTILRIESNKITPEINGINENKILLPLSDWIAPFKFEKNVVIEKGLKLYFDLLVKNMPCDNIDKVTIMLWSIATILARNPIKSRPILYADGEAGSGKTTSLRILGLAMLGRDPIEDNTLAATKAIGAKSLFMVLDNLETENMTRELNRFLLQSATTVKFSKRKLYTDNTVVTNEMATSIIIASIEGPHNKDEFISRILQVRFSESLKTTALTSSIVDDVLTNRPLIMSSVLRFISDRILPQLKDGGFQRSVEAFNMQYKNNAKIRNGDYLALMQLMLEELNKIISLPEISFAEIMERQDTIAIETIEETNPLAELFKYYFMDIIADGGLNLYCMNNTNCFYENSNFFQFIQDRDCWTVTFSSDNLKRALDNIVSRHKLERKRYPLKTASILFNRIKDLCKSLARQGYSLEKKIKTVNGRQIHRLYFPHGINHTHNLHDDNRLLYVLPLDLDEVLDKIPETKTNSATAPPKSNEKKPPSTNQDDDLNL